MLEVECHDAVEFARAAYHLGNRHTPMQIVGRMEDGHFALRIRADHVLADMLAGLGAHSAGIMAPFEPETGAYAPADAGPHGHAEHAHGHDDERADGHEHHEHHGNHMPAHEPRIHRPDAAAWKGTQDK